MNFAAFQREDRRGAILRILVDQTSYGANDGVLQLALDRVGHKTSRDTIRVDLSWLQEQGLVQVVEEHTVWVATITTLGEDVATGRTKVPGVKRPSPGG